MRYQNLEAISGTTQSMVQLAQGKSYNALPSAVQNQTSMYMIHALPSTLYYCLTYTVTKSSIQAEHSYLYGDGPLFPVGEGW